MEKRSANQRTPLSAAFTAPDAKRRYVRRLFGTIADRYDLITVLLSFGRDRRWKQRLIREVAISPAQRVLDLACGTGDLAFAAGSLGATVTGLDLTPRMIELARQKQSRPTISFLVGDMSALPVATASCDVVTTGYGLRNVPDLGMALAEIFRVLTPGGTFGSLDFDRPESWWLRTVFLAHLTLVGSTLGWILHRNPDTYRYIPESIRHYPGRHRVAGLMRAAGFIDVVTIPVFGGLMAIHIGRK
jgi:ubiquinone/menaquinone biosynthesis methyltransferase